MHFNVSVSNQGLADVAEAVFVLEADGSRVEEFVLGDVDIGASRLLSAQWIQVRRGAEELRFSVRGDVGVGELEEGNNVVEVSA